MGRDERARLRWLLTETDRWSARCAAINDAREKTRDTAERDIARLQARAIAVERDGASAWVVVPLTLKDAAVPAHLAGVRDLRPFTDAEENLLRMIGRITAVADKARPLARLRLFPGRKKYAAAHDAVERLARLHDTVVAHGVDEILAELARPHPAPEPPGLEQILEPSLGFAARFGGETATPTLLRRECFARLSGAIGIIDKAVAAEQKHVQAATSAGKKVRLSETRRMVSSMPLDALRRATRDRLRTGVLETAGITNVYEVLQRRHNLAQLPSVGATSVNRIVAAAQTLWETTYQEMPVRIDFKNRGTDATALVTALRAWDVSRRTKGATTDIARAAELRPLAAALDGAAYAVVVPAGQSASALTEAIDAVVARADMMAATVSPTSATPRDVWDDFLSRPADYYGMLAELGFVAQDPERTHGELPSDVIDAVRALELRTDNLTASLRGYQSFAARFALVQKKVIVGDEMGLGKTVEALAALAHLRSKGDGRFLVVCPAAIVSNWIRETAHHTRLSAHRLHGPEADRLLALKNWRRSGGVAVITYDLLGWAFRQLAEREIEDIACVILDEAHYVKNPAAVRSRNAARVITAVPRAILMSGTPLENRVEEFQNLIGYVRPDLARCASGASALRFRRHVAPVYLRRNQEDVLTELPELVEVDEWLGLTQDSATAYRAAVRDGNFMAMRRATMLGGDSEKLRRLIEIVKEAEDNGRRVIVYSYFLDVLEQVAAALPGAVYGPLTGKVQAARRQDLIDDFGAAGAGAVLVSQITAGGVGLNIQAASVVVICEPQLKPTTEAQAVARAHRMGQIQSVQVHRLLAENSVDERIMEILTGKKALFDEFARVSETAQATPDAMDITETEIARQVVAAERERLFSSSVDGSVAAPTFDEEAPAAGG